MNRVSAIMLFLVLLSFAGGAFSKPGGGQSFEICDSTDAGCVVTAMTFNVRVDTFLDVFNGWKGRRQIAVDTILGNAN